MSINDNRNARNRSDRRIPKLRTRGRANRERLLAQAETMIESGSGETLRFSDVFESANVSRGSAYRIYNGIDDLMQDLSSTWISNFVVFIQETPIEYGGDSWESLSDIVVTRSADYWKDTEETLKVLPRVNSNATEYYRQAVRELTIAIAQIFDRHFDMPDVPDWLSVLAMYLSLGDTIFADAVRRDGQITERRLVEAKQICKTYLSFYLPDRLFAGPANNKR